MAGARVDMPINGASDWSSFVDIVQLMMEGFMSVSLTEMETNNQPLIESVSTIIVKGTCYKFAADETITGWAGIGVSTEAYIYVVPNAATCTAIWSATAPAWDSDYQGWYNGNNRCIGGAYKDGSGNCTKKWLTYSSTRGVRGSATNRERIVESDIGALAVTEGKIGALAVTEGKIGALAVTTGKINDLAVTTGRINDLAVTEGKIGALAVTEGKIGALAVTTGKINDLAVTTGRINDLAVHDNKISKNCSSSSVNISASDTWVVPAHFYMFAKCDSTGVNLEMNTTAGWKVFTSLTQGGAMILSDGTNFRIYNTSGVSITVYYRQLV